ncbi:MAG: hypothetical protein KDA42_09585, partial [Planctomycetales bacterium]|nr:hypothetical protein [Planctomycetales bacterium]
DNCRYDQVKSGKPTNERLDSRLDDLVARLNRAEERHDTVQQVAFEKLDVIERFVSQVDSHLSCVATQLEKDYANMHESLEKLYQFHAAHDRVLNGRNGQDGLLIRTDRVEQYVASSRWMIRAVVAATITLVATTVAGWMATQ